MKVPEIQRKMYKCTFCERTTDRFSSLRIHLGTMHYKDTLKQHYGANEWECKHCNNRNFPNERHLLCHLTSSHNGTYFLKLNKADYEIKDSQHGAKHRFKSLKVARGLPKELFKCPMCSVTRGKYSNLLVHIASVHHRDKLAAMYGDKNWNCGLCPNQSTTESNLISHLLSSHQAIQEFLPTKDSVRAKKLTSNRAYVKKKK